MSHTKISQEECRRHAKTNGDQFLSKLSASNAYDPDEQATHPPTKHWTVGATSETQRKYASQTSHQRSLLQVSEEQALLRVTASQRHTKKKIITESGTRTDQTTSQQPEYSREQEHGQSNVRYSCDTRVGKHEMCGP